MESKFILLKQEIEKIISNSHVPTDPSHSENTRKWLLKLKPKVSLELEIAALAHDIERGRKSEYLDFETYDDYKRYHSQRSAKITSEVMRECNFNEKSIKKVKEIILLHETGGTEDADLLKDADSISFFDNNIEYYYKSRGEEKTRFKINYMFDRCSVKAKEIIRKMKFSGKLDKIIRKEIG